MNILGMTYSIHPPRRLFKFIRREVIIALSGAYGTLNEIASELKAGTLIISLDAWFEIFSGRIILTGTVPGTMTAVPNLLTDR